MPHSQPDHPTEAILLAGGLGTRLRGVVDDVPKPLAPIAGRPFLVWLLEALARGGVRHVVLATGYKGEMIHAAIGPRLAGLEITYRQEASPQGTGGAIRDALPATQGARVFVLNGDTYVPVPWGKMAALAPQAALTMAVVNVPDRRRFGTVEVHENQVRGFAEKQTTGAALPGLINGGVYLMDRHLPGLDRPGAFSFEHDILQTAPDIAALTVPGPFIDIGTPEDFHRAQTLLPAWHATA